MSPLLYLQHCLSTNDEILFHPNFQSTDVIGMYTFHQTKGRGQYGNSWKTTEHQNVAFTIAVDETHFKNSGALINFYTAVILRDFIANLTKSEVKIKWPNDLIIKNKKVAGILIEKKARKYIIGIGINVLQKDFIDLPKAGSILTQTGQMVDLHLLAQGLFHSFSHLFNLKIPEDIVSVYNKHLFRKDEISVFEIKGVRQNGIIQQTDSGGYLWINLEKDGVRNFFHKEIELLY